MKKQVLSIIMGLIAFVFLGFVSLFLMSVWIDAILDFTIATSNGVPFYLTKLSPLTVTLIIAILCCVNYIISLLFFQFHRKNLLSIHLAIVSYCVCFLIFYFNFPFNIHNSPYSRSEIPLWLFFVILFINYSLVRVFVKRIANKNGLSILF